MLLFYKRNHPTVMAKDYPGKKRPAKNPPPQPVHVEGMDKGEELARKKGKEPGRGEPDRKSYRTARDSTGVNAADREPIHPDMPDIPPV